MSSRILQATDKAARIQSVYKVRRIRRRQVPRIGDILGEVTSLRGLATTRGTERLEEAWRQAVGEVTAKYSRVGPLRRGTLEILVANSVLLQELAGFQKQSLLSRLQEILKTNQIRDLRFRLDGST
jgi:hypothetical protein